ncbi:hypothetical protein SDC9_196399 [bioreactor metagenome]|uniref:Uncharacterized protein n=1 Tax=bioreactor metagenome TaxID=1076179 RepID=A0A645IC24_9ZZZZ
MKDPVFEHSVRQGDNHDKDMFIDRNDFNFFNGCGFGGGSRHNGSIVGNITYYVGCMFHYTLKLAHPGDHGALQIFHFLHGKPVAPHEEIHVKTVSLMGGNPPGRSVGLL